MQKQVILVTALLIEVGEKPIEYNRECLLWTSYGKHGNEPPQTNKLKDLSTEHIENILKDTNVRIEDIRHIFEQELEYRKR